MAKLLPYEELIWSPVVANNRMNRERVLSGVNSYKEEIGLDILAFLEEKIAQKKVVNWIDLCCGEGKVVGEVAALLAKKSWENQVNIEGLDLVNHFDFPEIMYHNLSFLVGSIEAWKPQKDYDLITCVHGLHYVGDKLFVIQKAMKLLKKDGLFIANISLENVVNNKGKSLEKEIEKRLKSVGISYDEKRKILSGKGQKTIDFGLEYLGADDKIGANYTGQPVVNSVYND